MKTTNLKLQALANFLNIDTEEVNHLYEDAFSAEGAEYLVLTNQEADEAEDEYLEQYIDDCILPEIPEAYRYYFDDEAFKRDCKYDGRGHYLATYDGHENEEGDFYIYRTN